MIYGLCGSSGCGKTTLGRKVSDDMGLNFVETSITSMAKSVGFDPVKPMTIDERINLQWSLLAQLKALIDTCERPAIFDRTPLDMIGYMLCEITMTTTLTPAQQDEVEAYVIECLKTTMQMFDMIFMLGPLPTYEEASTRPALNKGYQIHSDLVMRGALSQIRNRVAHAILHTTDLDERMGYLDDLISKRLDHIEFAKRTSLHIN